MTVQLEKTIHTLDAGGVNPEISALTKSGPRAPMVFLHGLGTTKEDYAEDV